jgi:hypothetical protein
MRVSEKIATIKYLPLSTQFPRYLKGVTLPTERKILLSLNQEVVYHAKIDT